jgi:uncharacterized membrane protein YfcA
VAALATASPPNPPRREITRLGLTLGGIPGVLIAVWLVRSLPLDIVRWGVIVVVLYTAATLIRSAIEERRTVAAARASVPVGL